jgi:acyl-coenzyme A thioesterase PaaI-like protein
MELVAAIRAEKAEPPAGIATLRLDQTHRWITALEPGHVELMWDVQPEYANLEGAVICSWLAALADQALFFASRTLCGEGEETRTRRLSLDYAENVYDGQVTIRADIGRREGSALHGTCVMTVEGREVVRVDALIDVIAPQ